MATIEKRTTGTGGTSYRVKVRLKGEKPRTRTFKRLTDARAWAAKVESDLGHGVFVPTTADRRITFADLIDRFIAEYLPTKKNNRDKAGTVALLAWWREQYGHTTLDRLKARVFSEAKVELAKRTNRYGDPISGATINRYLAAASAVCKWAWKVEGLLPANPVLSAPKAAESNGVIRFLSDDERKALFKACRESADPNVHLLVTLALATGARYSNLRFLRWEDVDLVEWELVIERTKNGEPRRIPVVGGAQAALQAQLERDPTGDGWVFKGRTDAAPANMDKPWRFVRDAAGLEDFRFHDLRHTTATYLTDCGATLAQVAAALGQSTLVMALRYSHQNTDHVRATLAGIADKLGDEA
ncbi:site-specific integrase [Lysobacter sp. H21R4]|uniref:tyrosine-type recombinase/integrase n=1 Tax=Lysobacter sp. H21R4 TaxID=2781021 RepID=UPI0018881B60|nr:site-specific integrase [Lysobacter sp. H21R4]QOY61876.1 site-specific integrase [Lysobacter sp. H21R4]